MCKYTCERYEYISSSREDAYLEKKIIVTHKKIVNAISTHLKIKDYSDNPKYVFGFSNKGLIRRKKQINESNIFAVSFFIFRNRIDGKLILFTAVKTKYKFKKKCVLGTLIN